MGEHQPIPLESIQAARQRLQGVALHTPLVHLELEDTPAQIYLKLENLQPTGSFKLRGALNALDMATPDELDQGVWTASAGNFARGLAWYARRKGILCHVILPESASPGRAEALESLGARTTRLPFADYQMVQRRHEYVGMDGLLIHPFSDIHVMAGNGTIALEILEELPDVDAVLIPYGGGGLSCGIASALRALRPQARVYACEVESAAPLAASLGAGHPVEVDYAASFVSGMGAPFVFPEMWPLASQLLDASLVVSLSQVADAIRLLAERSHVIAEGAGAVAVAAALAGLAGGGKLVCIISGGNIDMHILIQILEGSYEPTK